MAAPGVDARASGRLGRLLTLFILAWFLPTGSGFAITSIGSFAQCFPTVITWDVGQSLPPFTLSISSISTASNPTDASLHFTGFEGVSATVTLNLPAKTRIDLVLENSGGVLAQALNLVIQPGTDSGCANSALSGSHPPEVASIVSSLPGLSTETSDTSTFTDAPTPPTVTSSSPLQWTSTSHSSSSFTTDPASGSITAPLSATSVSPPHSHKRPSSSRTTLTAASTSTRQPDNVPPPPLSFPISAFPTFSFVLPSGSSLSAVTSGTGLQPGVIGAIVACAIVGLALGLTLLFWCKRRRQDQREMRGARQVHSPGPSVSSFRRASVGAASVRQELASPSIFWREPQASPRSVGATIGEPSGEAIMEHRNKPLPTPDPTPSWEARTGSGFMASSPAGGTSSSQPMGRSTFLTSTPSIVTIVGQWRGFARPTRDSSRSARSVSNFSNVFDDTSSEVPSTAPPPYDWYYE